MGGSQLHPLQEILRAGLVLGGDIAHPARSLHWLRQIRLGPSFHLHRALHSWRTDFKLFLWGPSHLYTGFFQGHLVWNCWERDYRNVMNSRGRRQEPLWSPIFTLNPSHRLQPTRTPLLAFYTCSVWVAPASRWRQLAMSPSDDTSGYTIEYLFQMDNGHVQCLSYWRHGTFLVTGVQWIWRLWCCVQACSQTACHRCTLVVTGSSQKPTIEFHRVDFCEGVRVPLKFYVWEALMVLFSGSLLSPVVNWYILSSIKQYPIVYYFSKISNILLNFAIVCHCMKPTWSFYHTLSVSHKHLGNITKLIVVGRGRWHDIFGHPRESGINIEVLCPVEGKIQRPREEPSWLSLHPCVDERPLQSLVSAVLSSHLHYKR